MVEWDVVKLDAIVGSIEAGVSVNGEDRPARPRELGVLKVSCVSGGKFNPSENKAVVPGERGRVRLSLRKGDVLVSRANTYDLVGSCAIVTDDQPDLYLPDKLWRIKIRCENRDDPRWLVHLLNSSALRAAMRARATGTSSSMKNISQNTFLGIKVQRPSLKQQREIADVLDTSDSIVSRVEGLLAYRRRLKKALMQQLLTGKRRLPGFARSQSMAQTRYGDRPCDWPILAVGEFASERKETNGEAGLPVLSCTKHEGLVSSLEYFGKRIFSEDTSRYKVVRGGQFAYATNHIEEGSIGLLAHVEAGLVSPMYTVFEVDDTQADAQFLYRLFKTELYRHIFEVNTNASVNRRGSLRWKQFARLPVALPSLPEQKAIAEVLDTADREIELLERQLKLFKKQKRGLMQKLLTGQIRVKEAANA